LTPICLVAHLTSQSGWRRSGQANRQNQDARSGTNTPNRDGGKQQGVPGASGNVWGAGKGKGAGGGGGGSSSGGGSDRPAAQPTPVQAEQHVPVKDFNAAEVKEYLKKSEYMPFRAVALLFSGKVLFKMNDG
jgi:hypothetical protein